MLQCTTHLLWRINTRDWIISIIHLPICCNIELTSYNFQWKIKRRDGIISIIPLPCCNGQLTHYDFKWKTKNRDIMISIIPLPAFSNVQLTIYDFQWIMRTIYGMINHSTQHAAIHNSPPMVFNGIKSRDKMMSIITPSECYNLQLTSCDFQWRMKSRDGGISMIPIPSCCDTQLTLYFQWRMKSRDEIISILS